MHSVACVGDSQFYFRLFSSDFKLMLLTLPRMSWLDIYLNLLIFTICSFQGTWDEVPSFQIFIWLIFSSVIRNQNVFLSSNHWWNQLSQQHCPADWVGGDKLLLICACIYMFNSGSVSALVSFYDLAATYSPTPSPVQYHRPLRSLPSCSGWERVLPLNASPPKTLGYLITQQ